MGLQTQNNVNAQSSWSYLAAADKRAFYADTFISALPTKSRTHVHYTWSSFKPCTATGLLSEAQHKNLGISIRCQQLFYQFLSQVWSIHYVMLKRLYLSVTDDIFYLYTVALIVGGSICGNMVEDSIGRVHLGVAMMYIQLVGLSTYCPMRDPDPRKVLAAPVKQCLQEFKCWEAIPQHYSPLTKSRVCNLLEFCKDFPQDSKAKVFAGWCTISLHRGDRHCEWVAEKGPKHCANFPWVDDLQKLICQVVLDKIQLIGTGIQ